MVSADYVRLMTAYNAAMNRRLYAAASRLDDGTRRAAGGVFWGSLHGTLAHLLWADRMWMSRLAGWSKPVSKLAESAGCDDDFARLAAQRAQFDDDLLAWGEGIDADWLGGDLSWFSGAAQRDIVMPRAKIVVHLFNHQTHHRGQAHALLTRAGEPTGDTDLFLVVP